MTKTIELDGKRVIRDTDLARMLGFKPSISIRPEIESRKDELGDVLFSIINANRTYDRGTKAYYLTEKQALSLAGNATKARKQISAIFAPPKPKTAPARKSGEIGQFVIRQGRDGLCVIDGFMCFAVAAKLLETFNALTK